MRLPEPLAAAIQKEVERVDPAVLVRASGQQMLRYKTGDFSAPVIKSEADRAAYLAVRLPATYAASWNVFSEVRRLAPQSPVESILDLGAGPGTALWTAAEVFPGLRQATLLEADEAWLKLGKRVAEHSPHPVLCQARWIRHDLRANFECPAHDMVALSYALGELPQAAAEELLGRAWKLAARFLVVIEPGTMRGFGVIHAARSALITDSAAILAPCPHRDACPMAAARDWCHFSQRVPRTSLHRRLKRGVLAYEDEKFSYVVAARHSATPAASRIVRHPQKHGGHVQLMLCTRHGLETRTVSRSQGEDYRRARQAEWGGTWRE